jgi:hypothetical protein
MNAVTTNKEVAALSKTPEQFDAEQQVDLKDPALAAFLAWLIPGLGHLYQGRLPKAALFFICIMGTFSYGVYLGGSKDLGYGRSVYFSWREGDKRLHYLCQIGVGLPALPALVQAQRVKSGKRVWLDGFMAPPMAKNVNPGDLNADQPTAAELHRKLNRYLELGMAYTMIAGLLNILAIYDAWGGPVFSEVARKEDEEEDDGEGEEEGDKKKQDE